MAQFTNKQDAHYTGLRHQPTIQRRLSSQHRTKMHFCLTSFYYYYYYCILFTTVENVVFYCQHFAIGSELVCVIFTFIICHSWLELDSNFHNFRNVQNRYIGLDNLQQMQIYYGSKPKWWNLYVPKHNSVANLIKPLRA